VDGSGERRQLQVAYGNALYAARGPGAPETVRAFASARESAVGARTRPSGWRLAADYGLWVGSYVHGDLSAMSAHAAAFRSDVEAQPDSPATGVAHRVAGVTHWFSANIGKRGNILSRHSCCFQPGRDDDLALRFGQDLGVAAMLFQAIVKWLLGDVDRAISAARGAEAPRAHRLANMREKQRDHVRTDARRPLARRAQRRRTRPTDA
jgi:hypothetical protein